MNIKEILEKLSNAYGASGYESGAAEEVTSLLKDKIDDVIRDKMGSVIGVVTVSYTHLTLPTTERV